MFWDLVPDGLKVLLQPCLLKVLWLCLGGLQLLKASKVNAYLVSNCSKLPSSKNCWLPFWSLYWLVTAALLCPLSFYKQKILPKLDFRCLLWINNTFLHFFKCNNRDLIFFFCFQSNLFRYDWRSLHDEMWTQFLVRFFFLHRAKYPPLRACVDWSYCESLSFWVFVILLSLHWRKRLEWNF